MRREIVQRRSIKKKKKRERDYDNAGNNPGGEKVYFVQNDPTLSLKIEDAESSIDFNIILLCCGEKGSRWEPNKKLFCLKKSQKNVKSNLAR